MEFEHFYCRNCHITEEECTVINAMQCIIPLSAEDRSNHFNVPPWTQASGHHPSAGFSPEATWMASHLCHEQGMFIFPEYVSQQFDAKQISVTL